MGPLVHGGRWSCCLALLEAVEDLLRGPAPHVVPVVAPAVVVGDEPGVGLGLELADEVKRRRWKAGRQHSWRMVPWKRSHTELWLGDRGGIRTWVEVPGRQVGPEARGHILGTVVA